MNLDELQRLAEGASRAAFELWYVGHTFAKAPREIERDAQGNYILMQARQAWNAYHAGWLDRLPPMAGTPPNEAPPNEELK